MSHPLTAQGLTVAENAIFENLVKVYPKLYKDGAPHPEAYVKQSTRVLFVFREPNLPGLGGVPKDGEAPLDGWDMRMQLRGEWQPGTEQNNSLGTWWTARVGAFAHAVSGAIRGDSPDQSWKEFESLRDSGPQGGRSASYLQPFAYIQIRKTGGKGTSVRNELRQAAEDTRIALREQVKLYAPAIIIGCGLGGGSPARLLRNVVLEPGTFPDSRVSNGRRAWFGAAEGSPRVLLEVNHPSARGVKSQTLYESVWKSVEDVRPEWQGALA